MDVKKLMKNKKVLIAVAVVLVAIVGYFAYEASVKKDQGVSTPPSGGGDGNSPSGPGGGGASPGPPVQKFVCPHAGKKGRRGGCMADPNCQLANQNCTGKSCECAHRVLGAEVICSEFNGQESACKANQGRCEWSNGYAGKYPGYESADNRTCMTRSESIVPGFSFFD